jgi:hypothetical protein
MGYLPSQVLGTKWSSKMDNRSGQRGDYDSLLRGDHAVTLKQTREFVPHHQLERYGLARAQWQPVDHEPVDLDG